jgi:hypothetical protein
MPERQGTVAFVCPATFMLITPPQLHMSLEESFSAGLFFIITLAEPGAQGAVVNGIHGIGVSTPDAAAVAEATVGFAID